MARYVPPLSAVDIILMLVVALGSVVLAMLRSKEPGVETDRKLADTKPEPNERERLLRHYRRKWGVPDGDEGGGSAASGRS